MKGKAALTNFRVVLDSWLTKGTFRSHQTLKLLLFATLFLVALVERGASIPTKIWDLVKSNDKGGF